MSIGLSGEKTTIMESTVEDMIFRVLAENGVQEPARVCGEVLAALRSKHLLPVTQEYGVRIFSITDTHAAQEIVVVTEGKEEAEGLVHALVERDAAAGARSFTRYAGPWFPCGALSFPHD